MAVNNIEELVYNHVALDPDMASPDFNKVFYIINDDNTYAPYAILYLIDDPQDIIDLCATNQGKARFQCEVYTKSYNDGPSKRKIYQEVMKKLEGTTLDSFKISSVLNLNVSSNPTRTSGLFVFTFESIVDWEES